MDALLLNWEPSVLRSYILYSVRAESSSGKQSARRRTIAADSANYRDDLARPILLSNTAVSAYSQHVLHRKLQLCLILRSRCPTMSLGRLGASGGSRTGIRTDIALLPCSAWLQSRMLKSVTILLGVSVNVATLEGTL